MRELGLLEDAGGIETSFADVLAFVERCRFRDCAHAGEPGCGVNAAVASGELPSVRLESYRKLLAEIAASARRTDAVAAGRMKAHAKKINRALRSRAKLDPKLQRDE
jgi:ribosome biogenesis GTPase